MLNQELSDLELIVVDDGSTDATPELLHTITDSRMHCVAQPNLGISAAMNAGMRAATGEFVARLDSDDLWMPDMLLTLVHVLDTRPEIAVAYGKGQAIDANGHQLADVFGMPEHFPGESLRSLAYDDFTCNIALVARRSGFDLAGPYDESLIANEDWDMWLRLAHHCRFYYVDRILACVRFHDENFTGLGSPRLASVLGSRTLPLNRLFGDPDLPAEVRAMKSVAYTNVHLFCGQRWLQAGHLNQALHEFSRAIEISQHRLPTAIRAIWLALVAPRLKGWSWGRRVINWQAAIRRAHRASKPNRE